MNVPFVVGQWVRGERFYGRRRELATLLADEQPVGLLLGMRRMGKTSLLRQAELLAGASERRWLPVLWDLQGVATLEDLEGSFRDALLDAGGRLATAGVAAPEVAPGSLGEAAASLAAAAAARGSPLLLLCDESEDLMALLASDATGTAPVLQALSGRAGARLLLAGSPRLATLARQSTGGAGLLEACQAPHMLGCLARDEAAELLRQTQAPPAARPSFSPETEALLLERTGGHPFLLQLAAKRALETGDAALACSLLLEEHMVGHLVRADLALLEEDDRQVLQRGGPASGPRAAAPGSTERALALGLLRRTGDGSLEPGNWFLGRWLTRLTAPSQKL